MIDGLDHSEERVCVAWSTRYISNILAFFSPFFCFLNGEVKDNDNESSKMHEKNDWGPPLSRVVNHDE